MKSREQNKCVECGDLFPIPNVCRHCDDDPSLVDQLELAAIEYSKLRLEQARQKKARQAMWAKCEELALGRDPCFVQKLDDETCEPCVIAYMDMGTYEIGAKCGVALNKIHRLVKKLGE